MNKTALEQLTGLEQRIARLERANRLLKRSLFGLCALASVPLFIAATTTENISTESVSAEEFRITSEGKTVARITAETLVRGHALAIYVDGQQIADFYGTGNGGAISALDKDGHAAAWMASGAEGGGVYVNSPRAWATPGSLGKLEATAKGGSLTVLNESYKRAAYLKAGEFGGSLDISDNNGKRVGYFDATKNGANLMVGYDKKTRHVELYANLGDEFGNSGIRVKADQENVTDMTPGSLSLSNLGSYRTVLEGIGLKVYFKKQLVAALGMGGGHGTLGFYESETGRKIFRAP